MKKIKSEFFIFIIIFLLGVFFRLYKFSSIPFGLNHDAGLLGLVAIDLWHKLPFFTPFYTGWVGETMYHYFLGFNFLLFGISPATIKLTGATIGIFTLLAFYFLAKSLKSKIALPSLFFLAISGWHIIMDKSGWSIILVPLFQSITLAFLLSALKYKKIIYWIATGFFTSMSLYTYGAARIIPIEVFLTIILFAFFKKEFNKKLLIKTSLMTIVFILFLLPLIIFAKNNWSTFTSRMNYLSVTNRINQEKSLKPLLNNIIVSARMLHVRANGDDFFTNEPLLEKIPGYLFIIGLIYILFTIKRFESATIALWLFTGFLPGILSVPNGNHNFSTLVPIYVVVGQGASLIFTSAQKLSKQIPKIGYVLITLIFILSVNDFYKQYFSKERHEFFGSYPETTIVANYMNVNKKDYDFYLTDNYPRDALTFITYSGGDPFKKHYQWFENGYDFLTVEKQNKKGAMFFMFENPQNENLAIALKEKFPNSKKIYLPYTNGNTPRIASLVVVVPPK